MPDRGIACRIVLVLGLLGIALAWPTTAHAQALPGGIVVDAEGVLQKKVYSDTSGTLMQERISSAKAALGPKLMAYSKLRKVSLNRLERAISDHQGVLTDPMRYLAGLLRVHYVFYYPDSQDIVLAGPAEGWVTDVTGRVLGATSGRPIVQLQDLVVALRAFPPGQKSHTVIACSIDPTQQGLAAMQQFLRQAYANATPADAQRIVEGLRSSLGFQTIAITGVSPKTNFARILVEADYRMKLIGIGLETPPVRIVSFVQQANPSQINRNALFRFYFIPDYQCVRTTEDGLAMELVGDGVRLIGEDELVSAGGGRQASTGKQNKGSKAFVMSFTKKYPELAERSPVYAELRNVIDLSIVAAFLQQHDFYGKAGWSMPVFSSEKDLPVETLTAPKQVESVVTAIWKGNRLTTPIGGGVQIEATRALSQENRLGDEKGTVAKTRQEIKPNLAAGQWWWD